MLALTSSLLDKERDLTLTRLKLQSPSRSELSFIGIDGLSFGWGMALPFPQELLKGWQRAG